MTAARLRAFAIAASAVTALATVLLPWYALDASRVRDAAAHVLALKSRP